jgi:hypothetical protein
MKGRGQQGQGGKSRDWMWYLEQLRSNECLCGKEKHPKRSFCYRCYTALPFEMRQELYKQMGAGYEEAFEEAAKYLTENVW